MVDITGGILLALAVIALMPMVCRWLLILSLLVVSGFVFCAGKFLEYFKINEKLRVRAEAAIKEDAIKKDFENQPNLTWIYVKNFLGML